MVDGEYYKRIAGFLSKIQCLISLQNDDFIASGDADSLIKVWNITSGLMKISLIGHDSAISAILNLKNNHIAIPSIAKNMKFLMKCNEFSI
jgi:WD40 repeat protein